MQIYLYQIPFIIILGLLFAQKDSKRSQLWYILISSTMLILVASLRSPEWFTSKYNIDTLNYKMMFEDAYNMSWNEFWQAASARYLVGGEEFDVGFLAFNKIIAFFTDSFYIYSIICDLIFFVPFGILLYRYCTGIRQIVFAFIFYIALIQLFLLGGARQITAMGFDMMAMIAVIDRKQWRAILFFLLGVTMHFSSLLFLIPLLMLRFNTKPRTLKILHILTFAIFPLVLAFPNQVILFMGEASGMERYANYGLNAVQGGASTFIILIEFLSLFCLLAIRTTSMHKNPSMQYFYVMLPFFTLLAPLIRSNGSMVRISLYYHQFLAFLVPFAIECFPQKIRGNMYLGVMVGLIIFLLLGSDLEYYFFWQK